ncbi:hypothetical protein CI109_100705 [Kwoniella shandongensis]|uniref:Uncharacterized protein n=1 Tax=Kwoniella shandongensis TaxID=1734106 RepID=A0A5M6BZ13_9TREE|nr:uncharacterized protein CI109_003375 [Kwoniella shandongensis]KAA5528087.1 hypothetical protein CI109_003375 [Kwoniella shandongensis]
MSSSAPDHWEDLLRWLKEKHPGFETSLELRDVPGAERCLVATASAKPGETLLHIPASAMLNPLTLIRDSPIPKHLFPQPTHRISTTNSSKRVKTSPSTATSTATTAQSSVSSSKPLDTTQLLTLHIALTRDPLKRYPSEWDVYMNALPREFRPWHPLTWLITPQKSTKNDKSKIEEDEKEWEWWSKLAEKGLSPTTRIKLDDVKKRFEHDEEVIMEVLRKEKPFKSHNLATTLTSEDLLWAWLNVNTRSISLPLGLPGSTERMNHTLVPILDFINHSSKPALITPRVEQLPAPSPLRNGIATSNGNTNGNVGSSSNGQSSSSSTSGSASTTSIPSTTRRPSTLSASQNGHHLIPGKIDLRLLPPEKEGIQAGQEILFEYGGHSSGTLFAEYGFCEMPAEEEGEEGWLGLKYGEMDLGWLVDELCDKQGKEGKEEKEKVLEKIGCWGLNTIHAQPSPPHPSHALLMTLRVLHLDSNSPKIPNIENGFTTYISPANELAAISSLEKTLRRVVKESDKRLGWLERLDCSSADEESEKETERQKEGVVRMLKGMCVEEKVLAEKVLEKIEAGEDFS